MIEKLKALLSESIKTQLLGSIDVGLLFSGGTDSLSMLFTLLDQGIRPTLYTFRLSEHESMDSKVSKFVADKLGLKLVMTEIPFNINQLQKDVKYLITEFGSARKTVVQVTYPFLYIFPHVKEKFVVTGLSADSNYGTPKSMAIKFRDDFEGFKEYKKKIFSNIYTDGYYTINELAKKHDLKLIVPFRDPKVIDYLMNYSWRSLNFPRQKWFIVKGWQEHFNNLKVYRKNDNLQVGSKIRERMDKLLDTKLNDNYNRVDEIYKKILKASQ